MKKITTLQFKTSSDFDKNLQKLIELYEKSDSFIVLAPEVCLSGFYYEDMDKADRFSRDAIKKLCEIVGKKALVFSVIEKKEDGFYNYAKVIQKGKVIYEQAKHKLFLLGDEHKYFKPAKSDNIKIFEIDGIKIGLIICFELRFPELWKKIDGAEIILAPSMWGKPRAEHLVVLPQALAIINRAFVVVSNSANDDMAKESAIITPWGVRVFGNEKELIETEFDKNEIKKIKRAIPYE